MATAFDYTSAFGQQGGPFGSLSQGLQLGAQLAQADQQTALREAQTAKIQQELAANQAKAVQQQKLGEAYTSLVDKVRSDTWQPADFQGVALLAPKEQSEAAIKFFDTLSKDRQAQVLSSTTQVMAALGSKNPEIGVDLLNQRAEGFRKRGDEGQAKFLETQAKLAAIDPALVVATLGDTLIGLPGGKDAMDSLAKRNEDRRAAELAPATLAAKKRENIPSSILEAIDYANLAPDQQKTFQTLQVLKKPPAAVTKVEITNLEKGTSAELAKLVPDLYEQANSAASQLDDLPRYRAALNSAITGPFADQRLAVARVANALGFTGSKAIAATTELIQGNADMALKSRSLLTGQGQITEGEQKLLLKARSADINFTKDELNTLFDVFDRAAKAQYAKSTNLLKSAAGKSETAQMFLSNIKPLSPPTQEAVIPGAPSASIPQMPTGFRVIR